MANEELLKLKTIVEDAIPYLPNEIDLSFRPMFGGMGVYAHGQIFASLSHLGIAVKLPDALQNDLLGAGGTRVQWDPDSPPSKHYIVVPPAYVSDHEKLIHWLRASIDYVATLPVKKKKSKK